MNHTGKARQILYSATVLLVALLMLSSFKIDAYASNVRPIRAVAQDYNEESNYIKNWLKVNGFGYHEISNPRELYSLDEKLIALYFDIDNTGYIIINTIDYDVMEYSFAFRTELQGYTKLYYTDFTSIYGEICYSRVQDCYSKKIMSIETVKEEKSDFLSFEVRKPLAQKEYSLSKQNTRVYSNSGNNTYHESGELRNALSRWYTGYYCQSLDRKSVV